MQTLLEIRIGNGKTKPCVTEQPDGTWVIETTVTQLSGHSRALWVRTFSPKGGNPKDGKGFLIGPTRRLSPG